MARCKAGGAFCAKAFGSAQRRLEQLSGANDVSRLDMRLVRSSGAVAARGDDWRTPLWAGLNTLVFPLLLVGATTVVLLLAVRFSPFEFNSILYLIPVMVSAIRWGVVPAMVAALASVAVSDFLFLQPLYSFLLNEPRDVVDLALFLFVAVVTGNLAARLQREVDSSHRREHEIHHLYLLSRRLALCSTASDLVAAIQEYLTSHLRRPGPQLASGVRSGSQDIVGAQGDREPDQRPRCSRRQSRQSFSS
jgi:K+-sensing histidine kinase KdpD